MNTPDCRLDLNGTTSMVQVSAVALSGTAARTAILAGLWWLMVQGQAGIPGLFIGNTAEDVLRQSQTAVLAVKPSGFVTPVA